MFVKINLWKYLFFYYIIGHLNENVIINTSEIVFIENEGYMVVF